MFAYVGSRTTRERNARGEGISVFALAAHGRPARIQCVSGLVNPSYLTLNRRGDRLYAVHGDQQEASAFRVGADGRLAWMNTVAFEGRNPVHLALDPQERWLVVSVHLAGRLVVLPVLADGSLGAASFTATTFGPPGPHRIEQPFPKPHANPFDPSGRFVVVPDKGVDRVFTFRFEAGTLQPAGQPFVQARAGAGPRTAAFHPRGDRVYVLNELDCTVTTYAFDAAAGALTPLWVVPTLDPAFTGNSRAAAIQVNRAGTHLYTSARGADSIAVLQLDEAGRPHPQQTIGAGGRTPRFFTLAPDEKTLYALCEESDRIVPFAVAPDTGRLTPAGEALACGSPVCMVFGPARD